MTKILFINSDIVNTDPKIELLNYVISKTNCIYVFINDFWEDKYMDIKKRIDFNEITAPYSWVVMDLNNIEMADILWQLIEIDSKKWLTRKDAELAIYKLNN